ncbi:superoxide dismutase family protein [Sphingomonas profundi]|uniref:superoxide dismutase family protein n=1 Tax=Alterirhizorhabdus profundi TaxID=2681549 RepID=UPI0012E7B99C|nr:superoxide dismutase family protein [Sphingomonas profundi]
MRRTLTLCLLGTTVALAACSMDGKGMRSAGSTAMAAPPASATLTNEAGMVMGTATFTPVKDGVRLVVEGKGLTPGAHGLHIHTVGRCEAPGFTSAGPHWNPTNMKHGKDAPGGPHMGDVPNLIAGADGTGRLEATLPGTLTGGATPLIDADGAAIVIHAAADDYTTDPSGNSGGRIACGVINAG